MSRADYFQARQDVEDAARYRWLKEHVSDICLDQEIALCRDEHLIYVKIVGADDLDEAIDYGLRAPPKSRATLGERDE